MNNEFYEEFSKLSDKDKKEVLDIMKYKRNLENEELKKRLKKYEDPEDLTLMFMYCDLKAKDKIKELKERINKAIEYINDCDEYDDCCNGDEIIWILKGED